MSRMPKMTPGNSYFAGAPTPRINRSTFDRSASNKFDFDPGKLIPFYVDELLPGDTFEGKLHANVRILSALDKPLMDNIYLDVHFIVVPLRQVWDNFEKFMGARIPSPSSSIDFLMPKLTDPVPGRYFAPYSNFDYMGLPTLVSGIPDMKITALPSRCINHIYNELYRDENLQDMLPVPRGDGPDDIETNLYQQLLDFNKRKDYFTSAFTSPQKGPAALIPSMYDETVSIFGNGEVIQISSLVNSTTRSMQADTAGNLKYSGANLTNPDSLRFPPTTGSAGLKGQLTVSGLATINSLRSAEALQTFLERDNRGGTRYPELIYSHYKVISPDARQQRPELIGSGTMMISVNPITQTTPSPDTPTLNDAQGNLAATGVASSHSNKPIGFTYSSTEHQYVFGFLRARADLNYQQGIDRMWTRNTRYDFYWPEFAHLGEQAILQKELIATGVPVDDNKIFGYAERYGDYKMRHGKISGALRSNYPQSLDNWHLAQEFSTSTNLNGVFVEENPPIGRTVAVPSEKIFIADTFLELKCTRPMPVHAIPGWSTHL